MDFSPSSAPDLDLIIVGGGINGAALARLAAFQGLKVALFESGDFGQGTSSNTSKLLHGGLRYLETYDFGLVREAVRERARLIRLAPHLAEERRFLFPLVPQGRHGRFLVKCGLALYDGLAGWNRLGGHEWLPKREFQGREPGFLPGLSRGAYAYSDCVVDDARLCLETLLDAARLGAKVHNYHEVIQAQDEGSHVEVTVLNRLTGREKVVTAASAALLLGPWSDQVLRKSMGRQTRWVRPSQGTHLVLSGLSARDCLILPVPGSKRYFFVIPDKEGQHWVGTTENELTGDIPESPVPAEKEIEELRALTALYFPGDEIRVVGVFCGVRPLARAERKDTATLSREHAIHRVSDRIFGAVGGKYTTHRPLALDLLRHILGKNHAMKSIEDRPLPGAWRDAAEKEALRRELTGISWMPSSVAAAWMRRYGMRAREVRDHVGDYPDRQRPLPGCPGVLWGEMGYAHSREYARTPVDFLRRRTRAFFTPGGGLEALPEVAGFFGQAQPDYARLLGESADYPKYLERYRHQAVTG